MRIKKIEIRLRTVDLKKKLSLPSIASITLALHLAQPALESLSMDTIHDITLAIYRNSTLYAYFKLVCYHQAYIIV